MSDPSPWWRQALERYEVRIRRGIDWLRERLWVRPLLYCLGATAVVVGSASARFLPLPDSLPDIPAELIETLLSVLTASMLGVATFAVASMVSAYASVGTNATPRAFSVIVSDDMSKRALSTFVGAFIYGTVGIIALNLKLYDVAGRLTLFGATLLVYLWILWTFVSWVDSIARLGRISNAIARVEGATRSCLLEAAGNPRHGTATFDEDELPQPIFGTEVGYVQNVDLAELQEEAERNGARIRVMAPPGTFVGPGRALARVDGEVDAETVVDAFYVGAERSFSSDPRYGLVVLAQIAGRALSPGVNDPGTAIDILSSCTRLLQQWSDTRAGADEPEIVHENVSSPPLEATTLLHDAYDGIVRYGCTQAEVMKRLQRALQILAAMPDPELRDAALSLSQSALERARQALDFEGDEEQVAEAAAAVERTATELSDG